MQAWKRRASSGVSSFIACSRTPGVPKSLLRLPTAITRVSYRNARRGVTSRPLASNEAATCTLRRCRSRPVISPDAIAKAVPVRLGEVVDLVRPRIHAACGDLVQLRLPHVGAVAVDERDVDRAADPVAQPGGELEAAGAAADDDDAVAHGTHPSSVRAPTPAGWVSRAGTNGRALLMCTPQYNEPAFHWSRGSRLADGATDRSWHCGGPRGFGILDVHPTRRVPTCRVETAAPAAKGERSTQMRLSPSSRRRRCTRRRVQRVHGDWHCNDRVPSPQHAVLPRSNAGRVAHPPDGAQTVRGDGGSGPIVGNRCRLALRVKGSLCKG